MSRLPGKRARPVLRGPRRGNAPGLPDEIEVAYLALRHTLLGGYVLRSRDRAGAEQELWALLAVYQALRMAMTAAAEAAVTDPDRNSSSTR